MSCFFGKTYSKTCTRPHPTRLNYRGVGRGARLTSPQLVSLSRISHNKAPQAFLRALLVPDPRRYLIVFPQRGLGVGLHFVSTDPPLIAAAPPASVTSLCTHTACPRPDRV